MTRPNAYLVQFNRTYLNLSQSRKKRIQCQGDRHPQSIRLYFLKTKNINMYMTMNIEHSNTMLLSRISEKHKIQIKTRKTWEEEKKSLTFVKNTEKNVFRKKYRICQILVFGRGKIKRGYTFRSKKKARKKSILVWCGFYWSARITSFSKAVGVGQAYIWMHSYRLREQKKNIPASFCLISFRGGGRWVWPEQFCIGCQ